MINRKGVILNDFNKVKTKCQGLFTELGEEFTKKEQHDKMERAAGMKVELLDLAGIVELKNELIRGMDFNILALT